MIFFVIVVSALLSARIFLMPYIITGGGPGNATRVLSMLIYETGFSYMKMGQRGGDLGRAVRHHDGVHVPADAHLHEPRAGLTAMTARHDSAATLPTARC